MGFRQNHGFLSLPMSLLVSVLALSALGLLGLQAGWRSQARLQLHLDQCAAELALEIAKMNQRLEALNAQIRAARVARAAAMASGQAPVVAASAATLGSLILLQDAQRAFWAKLEIRWMLKRDCPLQPPALGGLPWFRPPPDALGGRPLEWPPSRQREFVIHFHKKRRKSHASIRALQSKWITSFSLPKLRTSIL
jgi:hypothetical protein